MLVKKWDDSWISAPTQRCWADFHLHPFSLPHLNTSRPLHLTSEQSLAVLFIHSTCTKPWGLSPEACLFLGDTIKIFYAQRPTQNSREVRKSLWCWMAFKCRDFKHTLPFLCPKLFPVPEASCLPFQQPSVSPCSHESEGSRNLTTGQSMENMPACGHHCFGTAIRERGLCRNCWHLCQSQESGKNKFTKKGHFSFVFYKKMKSFAVN